MGRNKRPLSVIEGDRRAKHLSNQDKKDRLAAEKAMKTGTAFREEPETKEDPVAHKEFLRLRKMYKEMDVLDGLDQAVLNRYCRTRSQHQSLEKLHRSLVGLIEEETVLQEKLNHLEKLKDVQRMMNQLFSNLMKMEEKLYLNPVARINNMPRKPQEKEEVSPMAEFFKRKKLNQKGGES